MQVLPWQSWNSPTVVKQSWQFVAVVKQPEPARHREVTSSTETWSKHIKGLSDAGVAVTVVKQPELIYTTQGSHIETWSKHTKGLSGAGVAVPVVSETARTCTTQGSHIRNLVQTHKRLKRTLFIGTKHSVQIFGVSPFSSHKTNT